MRYFRGGNWKEFEALPNNSAFLVRAKGTTNVKNVENSLRDNNVHYFMGVERKDLVNFYVPQDKRQGIEKLLRPSLELIENTD